MPIACTLHPEFGYFGSIPRLFRKSCIVFALMVFGLVSGVGAVTIFKAASDPDAMSAMALAPAEGLSSTARSTPTGIAESNSRKGEFAQEDPTMKPRCQKNATEHLGGDCIAGQTRRPRSTLALNERPAVAAVPIGHRDDPAVLPPKPAAPVVADTASAAETPSAEPTLPASLPSAAPTKTRERHHERVQRREGERAHRREREHREYASTPRHYSNRQAYQAGGYAGLWYLFVR